MVTVSNTIICLILDVLRRIFSVEGSQVIYNLGLGIGGVIGGIAGFKVIGDWRSERKQKSLIEKYSKQYPHKLFNNKDGWELTRNPYTTGDIHILDHRSKTRHWIANYQTFLDLPIPRRDFELTDEKIRLYKEYEEGNEILTTGRPKPS